ncbi:bifunctional hydroxymethylpyrimidine kinase/phosphomethylpyrimidine kinase [Ammoniphilus sp. CFH 90114]|uniref:bifunctional hydroxymethylpyrimidine kinase/phosphomethylpyrimidine kinase n=1 Tax=Ammoniphilus sp. CFH 90114 TaxID=2493665 RepID=UPI00100D9C35|nr:bifunctional hydroxymethylpyrimidine kinase/phosphomethylpyrimidine kinase [Ammoniphilus sp. CFH 90114]RXT15229.1 bifunctional hydroxymethylpyrimidine kinase/phosphomethylpyrimidine kinase [Ammoniphilus sp. CFH 90114]
MKISRALTIAGSDSGGGAGIQADLKTFTVRKVYGMSAITAITAQNTLGVEGIHPIPLEMIAKQIEMVIEDIGVDAVKTGMLGTSEIIELVADRLKRYEVPYVVVDPVMVAKGGAKLLQDDAVKSLITSLLPLASIVTPNIPEAEVITGKPIHTLDDMLRAAKEIVDMGAKSVIVKGGHLEGEPIDLFYDGVEITTFKGIRIPTRHTHGTGCTFAACLTAELAKGHEMIDCIRTAKAYITAAISKELGLGKGHGPTNHWAYGVGQDE